MTHIVSITSQGQISIPAKLRAKLGLNKSQKAIVSEEKGKLIIEPIKDILELSGIFSGYAIKGKSIDEIIALEKKAVEASVVENYHKKMKRTMGIPTPKKE